MKDVEFGEIIGILKSFTPKIDRIEERVNDSQKEITELKVEVRNLKESVDRIKGEHKEEAKTKRDHFLEMARLVFAGVLGAGLTWLLTKI